MQLFNSPLASLRPLAAALLAVASLPLLAHAAEDEVWVVTKAGVNNPNAVAVVPFMGDSQVTTMLTANLNSTELGATNQSLPQMQAGSAADIINNINAWRAQGYRFVVAGRAHSIVGNKIAINYEIVDVGSGGTLGGMLTQVADNNSAALRTAANQMSNHIYQLITGNAADFGSRIIYVEENNTPTNKTSTLKLIDSSGADAKTLYSVQGSIFNPTVSPDGSRIAFSVQKSNELPVIHLLPISGGASRIITPFWGHNLSPSFSADGNSILFSGSHENNNPNIYRLNLSANHLEKIIDKPGAENSPRYLPDGTGFIYTADNGSRRQSLYRYQLNNGVSTQLATNATNPTVSHDGSRIAYVSGGRIVITNSSGSTQDSFGVGGTEIAASFSPSGRQLVYSTNQGSRGQLIIRNLSGGQTRSISTAGLVRDPQWLP